MQINTLTMWQRIFDDLDNEYSSAIIATRFHLGLANAIAKLIEIILTVLKLLAIALKWRSIPK